MPVALRQEFRRQGRVDRGPANGVAAVAATAAAAADAAAAPRRQLGGGQRAAAPRVGHQRDDGRHRADRRRWRVQAPAAQPLAPLLLPRRRRRPPQKVIRLFHFD